jgi:hypothetical protein
MKNFHAGPAGTRRSEPVSRGHATGAFWAVTEHPIPPLLVEARTAGDLVVRMRWARTTVQRQR